MEQADALQVVVREQPFWRDVTSLEGYLVGDRASPITYSCALGRTAIVESNGGAKRPPDPTRHDATRVGCEQRRNLGEGQPQIMQCAVIMLTVQGSSRRSPGRRFKARMLSDDVGNGKDNWWTGFGFLARSGIDLPDTIPFLAARKRRI